MKDLKIGNPLVGVHTEDESGWSAKPRPCRLRSFFFIEIQNRPKIGKIQWKRVVFPNGSSLDKLLICLKNRRVTEGGYLRKINWIQDS